MARNLSDDLKHFFHVVSNVRPIVWIGLYVALTPVFALIYMALPDGQFRIPDGAGTDFGSWMYYSIVTITTLGFGDYTPAHGWAQMVTAVEVMCGLILLGFFLNAVGSMKSEIDVESEVEKQRLVHEAQEKAKLKKMIPIILHNINMFLSYCYAITTPLSKRNSEDDSYNPGFKPEDMEDMYKPSGLSFDDTKFPAVQRFIHSASQTSLCLDSLQRKVDLSQWPDLLENSFGFVASYQMFSATDVFNHSDGSTKFDASSRDVEELYHFIKENAGLARKLETDLTMIASEK